MPRPDPSPAGSAQRTLRLAVIGTGAGLFSGLFGVGGGTVIVPLLVLWLGYGTREATGTSLGAIVLIAAAAMLAQGAYGNVHVGDGVLVGVPAVGGVLVGTSLQQRVDPRAVSLLFAALMVATAISLLIP
ncbi:MAG TPA: sulfite exporter TauE/SafE family protein [Baekduia sp.]|nr:sulfite exporter TauE/SafE family protein [Baekduia sp.]